MWGHSVNCRCGICCALGRVFQCLSLGVRSDRFQEFGLRAVRLLESELRDQLWREGISDAPFILGPPPPVGLPPPGTAIPGVSTAEGKGARGEPADSQTEGKGASASAPPKKPIPAEEGPQQPAAPAEEEDKKPLKVKEEPHSPESKESATKEKAASPVVPLEAEKKGDPGSPIQEISETPAPSASSTKDTRKRTRSSPEDSRSRKRKRSRSRRRRRRDSSSPRKTESGKERKQKPSSVPEPPGSPPAHVRRQFPRPPDHPPPGLHRLPPRPGPGSQWRGPIPVSDHPRWQQGTNKGITKRAKQEIHSYRGGRR